jgi:cellobiose phosphorylase
MYTYNTIKQGENKFQNGVVVNTPDNKLGIVIGWFQGQQCNYFVASRNTENCYYTEKELTLA